MKWFVLIATIVCNVSSNTLLKVGVRQIVHEGGLWAVIRSAVNLPLLAGVILAGATLLSYMATLSRFDLSVAYPTVTASAILLVSLMSLIFLNEAMHVYRVIGCILILIGVSLLFVEPPTAPAVQSPADAPLNSSAPAK